MTQTLPRLIAPAPETSEPCRSGRVPPQFPRASASGGEAHNAGTNASMQQTPYFCGDRACNLRERVYNHDLHNLCVVFTTDNVK